MYQAPELARMTRWCAFEGHRMLVSSRRLQPATVLGMVVRKLEVSVPHWIALFQTGSAGANSRAPRWPALVRLANASALASWSDMESPRIASATGRCGSLKTPPNESVRGACNRALHEALAVPLCQQEFVLF